MMNGYIYHITFSIRQRRHRYLVDKYNKAKFLFYYYYDFHTTWTCRAQSVRRTSLRDKTLTTKKDAVEETRLRLKAQEVC